MSIAIFKNQKEFKKNAKVFVKIPIRLEEDTAPNVFDVNSLLQRIKEKEQIVAKEEQREMQQQENEDIVVEEKQDETQNIATERKIRKKRTKPFQVLGNVDIEGEPEETGDVDDAAAVEREQQEELPEENQALVEQKQPVKKKPLRKQMKIVAPNYYLNDRKIFIQLTNRYFDKYKTDLLDETKNITCDNMRDSEDFSLLTHQKIVRDYMNLYSPYRGLLLYHGLGSGKTCTSIAIAEGLKNGRKVLVMTPASLRSNYISELKKCGDQFYKKQNYWKWVSIRKHPELLETMNLSKEFIDKYKGAWIIDVSKQGNNYDELLKNPEDMDEEVVELSNKIKIPEPEIDLERKQNLAEHNELLEQVLGAPLNELIQKNKRVIEEQPPSEEELLNKRNAIIRENQKILNLQIDELISQKYEFINYNGLRKSAYTKLREEGNIFNNKVIIIDEAHNLISRIVNQLNKLKTTKNKSNINTTSTIRDALSIRIYKDLLSAENARIVLLSGTPIINYPNEIGILFNILRGFIKTYNFKLISRSAINLQNLKHLFRGNNKLDYINYNANTNILSITQNPFGFQNVFTPAYRGVTNVKEYITNYYKDFISTIISTLREENISVENGKPEIQLFTALPDNLNIFEEDFIENRENVYTFKNPEKFKRRIMGLTSYFRSAQEELLPRYDKQNNLHILSIPMSDYQFKLYEEERKLERVIEAKQKSSKKAAPVRVAAAGAGGANNIFKDPTSTFKIYSRMWCNFVMPAEFKRPKPDHLNTSDDEEDEEPIQENAIDTRIAAELEGDEIMLKEGGVEYARKVQAAVRHVKTNASTLLSKQGLAMYSPKFLAMLDNIQNPEHIGLNLIYSQFRTFEGIEIFTSVLDTNGFAEFKIKKVGRDWEFDFDVSLIGKKPMYALYTGTENSEEREIIRNIYNGVWKNVPKSLAEILTPISNTNNRGIFIKVLMITAAGSEGINLFNTRYVHIMEPYWNMVRVEQVIGRARRICSHQSLPLELQTVDVFIYLMSFTQNQSHSPAAIALRKSDVSKFDPLKYVTSDETLFEISTIKDNFTNQLLRAVKEASIDCATHIKSSSKEGLQCLSFGTLDERDDTFSYNPDINMDINDDANQQNMQQIQLVLIKKFADVNGVKTAFAVDESNGNIYDIKSYEFAKSTKDMTQLKLVGIYKNNGFNIFK